MVDDDNYLVMPRIINDLTLSVHTPLYICVCFAGNISCPAGNETSLELSRDGRVYFYWQRRITKMFRAAGRNRCFWGDGRRTLSAKCWMRHASCDYHHGGTDSFLGQSTRDLWVKTVSKHTSPCQSSHHQCWILTCDYSSRIGATVG
jgi:hypothetical protein